MEEEGMDLIDLLKALLKNWIILVVFLVLGITIGCVYSLFLLPDEYEAKSSLLVVISHDGEPVEYDYNNSLMIINTVKELSKQSIILEQVATNNNLNIEDLSEMVEVSNPSSSLLLVVTCKASSKEASLSIANDMTDVLIYQCTNNPELAMIGNSLIKTSSAGNSKYVGKNKAFTSIAIALIIFAIGVVVALFKEYVIKGRKKTSKQDLNQV